MLIVIRIDWSFLRVKNNTRWLWTKNKTYSITYKVLFKVYKYRTLEYKTKVKTIK